MTYPIAVMIAAIIYGSSASTGPVPSKKVNHCASTGPVENQELSGVSWAFAASHTLTGRLKMRDGPDAPLLRLSEQQLIDCCYDYRSGLTGGSPADAWATYAKYYAATTTKYPYTGTYQGRGKCGDSSGRMNLHFISLKTRTRDKYSYEAMKIAVADGVSDKYSYILPSKDIEAMKIAVADGPVTVSMFVGSDFRKVGKGIYTSEAGCAERNANHAMVVCGYDTDSITGQEFWIVKNSWGKDWGDNGYIKVAMGSNVCGIESNVEYPTLDDLKTDISNMCVNDKHCAGDRDCNNIKGACGSGKCQCNKCVSNIVCQTDADCGGRVDSCTFSVQSKQMRGLLQVNPARYCNCNDQCQSGKECTADAGCGAIFGACRPTGRYRIEDGNHIQISECDCETECLAGKICEGDIHCGAISGACRRTGRYMIANGNHIPISKCDCDTKCRSEKICEGDIHCGGIRGACRVTRRYYTVGDQRGEYVKRCVCEGKRYSKRASNFTVAFLEILFVLVVITTFINLSCYYCGKYGYNDQIHQNKWSQNIIDTV